MMANAVTVNKAVNAVSTAAPAPVQVDALAKLGVQVPALALVVFLVVWFLKHLANEGSERRKIETTRMEKEERTALMVSKALVELTLDVRASTAVTARLSELLIKRDARS